MPLDLDSLDSRFTITYVLYIRLNATRSRCMYTCPSQVILTNTFPGDLSPTPTPVFQSSTPTPVFHS